MSAPVTQRLARLQALGVTPYRLRGRVAADAAQQVAVPVVASETLPCVLLLPEACTAQALDRVGRAMQAFGATYARAPRIQVPAAGLRQPPPRARAYLAFGEAQARALGQVLSASEAQQVEVIRLDAPEQLAQGAAKQRLWQALKSLRARLAIQ